MKRGYILFCLGALLSLALLISCGDKDTPPNGASQIDRKAFLTNLADNIIIPGYSNYLASLTTLKAEVDQLQANTDEVDVVTLEAIRMAYINAYTSWQYVELFEIGPAETIGLRSFSNVFPTDVILLEANIESGNYNLELPSTFDAQGFPAIDYLLFRNSDEGTIARLNSANYRNYLLDIVNRLYDLTAGVNEEWGSGFRDTFIENDGSSATASTDKIINDFLFHYERFLRAGRVGIPAGVFSGSPIPELVEGVYSKTYSKSLLINSFEASKNFFIGKHQDHDIDGFGLDDLLIEVDKEDLVDNMLALWEIADQKIAALDDDLKFQVESENLKMLEAYDALQAAVIPLKVDMMQALNVQVDFVDADGD